MNNTSVVDISRANIKELRVRRLSRGTLFKAILINKYYSTSHLQNDRQFQCQLKDIEATSYTVRDLGTKRTPFSIWNEPSQLRPLAKPRKGGRHHQLFAEAGISAKWRLRGKFNGAILAQLLHCRVVIGADATVILARLWCSAARSHGRGKEVRCQQIHCKGSTYWG